MSLKHFLLVFDHDAGELVRCDEFSDARKAVDAYSAIERENEAEANGGRLEIVLIGSDSIETVRRTHSNYFGGTARSKYLAGL